MNIYAQKKGLPWKDEAGNTIPFSHIKNVEKVNEKSTYDVARAALKVSEQLKNLRSFIEAAIEKAVEAFHKEYNGKKVEFKGNYTIYNFDRSIKIEINVSNPIQFDDLAIQQARDELRRFLNDGVSAKNEAIKQMVLDAFETGRQRLDVKKILSLKRYTERINDKRYSRAMQLIDQAIRRPFTATYYRVWVRNEKGQYENIPLCIADV